MTGFSLQGLGARLIAKCRLWGKPCIPPPLSKGGVGGVIGRRITPPCPPLLKGGRLSWGLLRGERRQISFRPLLVNRMNPFPQSLAKEPTMRRSWAGLAILSAALLPAGAQAACCYFSAKNTDILQP